MLGLKSKIRVVIVAYAAKADKFASLHVNIVQRKLFAHLTKVEGRVYVLNADFFHGFQLDRQTVGIPSRDIRSLIAAHILIFDDNIFKHFVKRSAHMDVAVGVWRAVVKNVERKPFVFLHQFLIKLLILPSLYHFRLFLRKIAAHWEVGFRQIHS